MPILTVETEEPMWIGSSFTKIERNAKSNAIPDMCSVRDSFMVLYKAIKNSKLASQDTKAIKFINMDREPNKKA